MRNAYGKRGEEAVYQWEIERLTKLGMEDSASHIKWWRQLGDETANHDMVSTDLIDGKWVDIFIEVKATPARDFTVFMTRNELDFAFRKKESYRLYRVVDVATASPQIYIYKNPYILWSLGLAQIEPRDTTVYLPRPGDEF